MSSAVSQSIRPPRLPCENTPPVAPARPGSLHAPSFLFFACSRSFPLNLPAHNRPYGSGHPLGCPKGRGSCRLGGTRCGFGQHIATFSSQERGIAAVMANKARIARTTVAPPPRDRTPSRRVRREQHTLIVMIHMYCTTHHPGVPGTGRLEPLSGAKAGTALCQECDSLLAYALTRIEDCRFGDDKPACTQCPVHCFRPDMRQRIRAVMRYAGPRMTLRHPYLAVRHLLDARATSPEH